VIRLPLLALLALALVVGVPSAQGERRPAGQPREIVWSGRHGFDWIDAAVGAAGGIGAVLLLQALVLPSIRRRKPGGHSA
jgi:hypothetical protein